jgi:beta-phosphoglucomutase
VGDIAGFLFPMTPLAPKQLSVPESDLLRKRRRSIRGVVFDMDGVIVDSHPSHRAAWNQFFQSVGCSVSDSEIDFILDGRKRAEILRHFLGEHLSPEEIRDYGSRKDQMLRELGSRSQPIDGAIEFLVELRRAGLAMALATSAARGRTEATLSDLGIKDYFDIIVTGDDVPIGKPDPSLYRLAAAQLKENPIHLLAFEDAVSGVRAALCAGLRCVGVASGHRVEQLRAAGAEVVISNFNSLRLSDLFTNQGQ